MRRAGRAGLAGALAVLLAAPGAASAAAGPAPGQSPGPLGPGVGAHQPYPGTPPVDPARLPAGTLPVPGQPPAVRSTDPCTTTTATAPAATAVPWGQQQLGFTDLWQLSDPVGRPVRGAGITVAVIDTGVAPDPRLPRLVGGGDAVGSSTGTEDCDAHGTLVAGIVAATPDPATGFTGVAPDVSVLSIRQSSVKYVVTGADGTRSAAGTVLSLAAAVVRAADAGAQVINISEAACGPAGTSLGDAPLGAAVRYATRVRDAVVVAAAGNVDPSTACATQNALTTDPQGVTAVSTVASPAWYGDDVLTVGSVEQDGSPSSFSLAGPWVDVAAPGSGIVTLDPAPGGGPATDLVGESAGGQPVPIQGTSFATPYVAGTVALVRQRFPELRAPEVVARIEATAHHPGGGWNPQVGHGMIDPVAAVTTPAPGDTLTGAQQAQARQLEALPAPPPPDTRPRTVALVGSGAALALLVVAGAVGHAVRRARRG
ncbi:type VII secretion-associated serine protease mycosin [Rhodococcus aerolatus]